MKTRATTIIAACVAALTTTYATSITWKEDSFEAFNLELSGTGPGVQGFFWDESAPGILLNDTFASPSGLWEVEVHNYAAYRPDFVPSKPFEMSVQAEVSFLGVQHMYAPNYNENVGLPAKTADVLDSYLYFGPGTPYWTGWCTLEIVSIPDFLDASTWSWVSSYHASGPNRVPDYGNSGLCLAFAAGLLLFFRPRKEKAWTN